jgi:hypothetical protein
MDWSSACYHQWWNMSDQSFASIRPGRPDRILVLGTARSGTRWLATAMGHAEGARVVKEPDNIDADPTGSGVSRLGFGPYPLLEPSDVAPQFRALWDLAFSARVPNKPGFKRTAARAALRLPASVREPLLRRSAQAMSALPGRAPHVVVKSIYAQFCLDWLVERYDPRVVVIERHPLNVVSSWAELGVHGFDLLERPLIRERYLEPLGIAVPGPRASALETAAACVGLLTSVLRDQVRRHPEWLVVTHESLCADPQARIREVCERVGPTWTEEATRFLAESNRPGEGFSNVRVTSEQPNRWRGRLSDLQVEEVQAVLDRFPSRGRVLDVDVPVGSPK